MPKADKRVQGIAGPVEATAARPRAAQVPGPNTGSVHPLQGSSTAMRGLGRWRRLCLRSVRTELRLPHSMCPQSAASRPWGCGRVSPSQEGGGGESRDPGEGISCTRAKGFKAEAPSFPEVSFADPITGPLRIRVVRGEVTGGHVDCLLPPGPDGESVSLALRTPVCCPVSQPCGQFCTEKKPDPDANGLGGAWS